MPVRIVTILFLMVVISACAAPGKHYKLTGKPAQGDILKQQGNLGIDNAEYEKRLKEVGARIENGGIDLCSKLGKVKGGCIFSFNIASGDEDSAYAGSNKIYITPAIIGLAKTDDELAIILGHEYAHNVMGHIKSRKNESMAGSAIGKMLGIEPEGDADSSKQKNNISLTRFSIQQEKEADYAGLYITAIAGYDITGANDLWHRVSAQDSKKIYIGVSHPSNSSRFLALEKYIAEVKHKVRNGAILVPNLKD